MTRVLIPLLIIACVASAAPLQAAAPPPAAKPGPADSLTVDLMALPLAQALATLARAAGVNLVVQGDTSGTVSLHIAHQTFEATLAILAQTYNLDVRKVSGAYIVKQLTGTQMLVTPAQAASPEIVVRTYHLRYAMASEVVSELRTALGVAPRVTTGQQTVIGQPPSATSAAGGTAIVGTPGQPSSGTATGAPSSPGGYSPSGGTPAPAMPSAPPAPATPAAPSPQGPSNPGQGSVAIVTDERTNSIVVSAPFTIQTQIEEVIASLDQPGGPPATIPGTNAAGEQVVPNTFRYPVHYADPQALAAAILVDVPGTSIVTDLRTNTLLVTGDPTAQRRAAALLQSLDSPNTQIVIQAEILDISKAAASQLGIQWTYQPFQLTQQPGGQLQGNGVYPIIATLNALVAQGQGKVLANPQVATQNGVQAAINVGQTLYVPVQTVVNGVVTTQLQTINAGLLLEITPRLNTAGEITNTINVESNSISGYSPQGYPNITQRTVQSIITVNDGQPILIGGLISQQTTENLEKIPVLGDIPLLGALFRYKTTDNEYDNITIILTPRLLKRGQAVPLGTNHTPGG